MESGLIGWHLLIILGCLALAGGTIALWIVALLQITKSYLDSTAKAIWVLIVVVAPFLGALAWFFIGAQQAPPLTRR